MSDNKSVTKKPNLITLLRFSTSLSLKLAVFPDTTEIKKWILGSFKKNFGAILP